MNRVSFNSNDVYLDHDIFYLTYQLSSLLLKICGHLIVYSQYPSLKLIHEHLWPKGQACYRSGRMSNKSWEYLVIFATGLRSNAVLPFIARSFFLRNIYFSFLILIGWIYKTCDIYFSSFFGFCYFALVIISNISRRW